MFRKTKLYPCMAVVLAVICFIFLSNCGGGGNSSVVPNTNPTTENPVSYTNPTPTPVLSNVNVSGYLYVNNTVTEDGETIPSISVLDVPACQSDSSGNESFLTQFSNSIKADYPEDWARPEVQELYNQLNKTLSESKPLPECNGQVYSVYSENPIPVSSDGHFDNTVLTGATDSNVKLEVALGEDNYAEVETLPSSGNINSSDATSAAVLKSCPEKIFAFPGTIALLRITADGVNLKKAGLKVSLDNPEIGCISQPVYLCIFGEKKYQTSYICLYVKNGLDTPVSTNITATTNTGLSLKIFTEVIKRYSSISGTVYTGGMPLVKGFVYSLGPKACCKLDSNGAYTLPKVFRGHERSVVAVWQTSENGQKVRHREDKVIDFFNADVAGLNFGVPPTPIPTATPTVTPTPRLAWDSFYDVKVSNVLYQFEQWRNELGTDLALQKTINWLNATVNDRAIPDEIIGAEIGDCNTEFWIHFADGMAMCISVDKNYWLRTQEKTNKHNKKLYNTTHIPLVNSSNVSTVDSNKILILAPYVYEDQNLGIISNTQDYYSFPHRVYGELADDLENVKDSAGAKLYQVTRIMTVDCNFIAPTAYPEDPNTMVRPMEIRTGYEDHVITPDNYKDLKNFGVIFLCTHGINADPEGAGWTIDEQDGLLSGPFFRNSKYLQDWVSNNLATYYIKNDDRYKDGTWTFFYKPDYGEDIYTKHIRLNRKFFYNNNIKNSIIYMDVCWGNDLANLFPNNTYLGYDHMSNKVWGGEISYYFFFYMMYGYIYPETIPGINLTSTPVPYQTPHSPPLSASQAWFELTSSFVSGRYRVNPDPMAYPLLPNGKPPLYQDCMLICNENAQRPNVYFPIPIEVIVEKEK